jgi:hypothetical protein
MSLWRAGLAYARHDFRRRNENAKFLYPAASGTGSASKGRIPAERHVLASDGIYFFRADPAYLSENHLDGLVIGGEIKDHPAPKTMNQRLGKLAIIFIQQLQSKSKFTQFKS